MRDGQRVYPVDELFIHHSTGPEFANAGDLEVQDWFSMVGRGRGYNNGATRSYHKHPQRDGETYAQAHFALIPYAADGNKYGYRLVELISDPWNNVAWHAGDWAHNQRSIGIEVCGNFVGRELPEKALMLLADFWRPQDAALSGKTTTWAHQWVYATACPGGIVNQIEKIVDMQNNPEGWNARLFPAPAPVEPIDNRPEWVKNFNDKTDFIGYTIAVAPILDLNTGLQLGTIPAGKAVELSAETTIGENLYLITNFAVDNGKPNGIPSGFITTNAPVVPAEPYEPTPEPVDPEPTPETPIEVPTEEGTVTITPSEIVDWKAKLAGSADFIVSIVSQSLGQLISWGLTLIPMLATFDGGRWKWLQFPLGIVLGAALKRWDRVKHEDSSDSKGILPV